MKKFKYYCKTCCRSYTTKKHLIDHYRTETHKINIDRLIICKTCGGEFSTKTNCNKHNKKIHGKSVNFKNITDITEKDITESHGRISEIDLLEIIYVLKHKNEILEKDNFILKLEKDNQIQKEKYEKELYKQKAEILERNIKILEKDKTFAFAQDISRRTIKIADTAVKGLI